VVYPPLVADEELDPKHIKELREQADVVEVRWPTDALSRTPSAAFTAMRLEMNRQCRARIAFGGKLTGYRGTLPGALEEVVLSLRALQPLYLLGGLGGVSRAVYDVIVGRPVPTLLTFEGQIDPPPPTWTHALC
jgi:hypothetical protein